ncbi:MAG: hypothetical protein A2508_00235 [Candidatus Lambdaproteobacteria bacterium RIFOXYD12_FULL_49_8]|nr:MAG: hypothetical protein A2508_00235 [Candidatus Lambdaproteobacteria bacterium RIFOXYD12_FULL_49_8]
MARLLSLPKLGDPQRGFLTVIEKIIPFEIKRVYYIYGATGPRGGHRHKKCVQALVSVTGSCVIQNHDGKQQQSFLLDDPAKLLLLEPEDWHIMENWQDNCVLLVLASEEYDPTDYIDEGY